MARDLAVSPESFEEILAWLSANREIAATKYVQLRHDLAKIFIWRGCNDPEGLTDEVFDRVAKKVHEIRATYEGDPRLYFRAVANNLIKETLKQGKTHVPLESLNLPQQSIDTDERKEEALKILAIKEKDRTQDADYLRGGTSWRLLIPDFPCLRQLR